MRNKKMNRFQADRIKKNKLTWKHTNKGKIRNFLNN